MHLLIAHLLDAAAVGELIWDRYLAPAIRRDLDDCTDGRGRALLALVCGLHDVGKVTPAFQSKVPELAEVVQAAGFGWSPVMNPKGWHHTLAGARIVKDALTVAGWGAAEQRWFWPLIAGHHGRVPGSDKLRPSDRQAQGRGLWPSAQQAFVQRVQRELGADLGELAGVRPPTRATQLALSGLVIMADWIASDDTHFSGLSRLGDVSMDESRRRAGRAWASLRLRGGWDQAALRRTGDVVKHRFGEPARASQRVVMELAAQMPDPGLLIVEAPMGEGKTEAALAAAEILAGKFGADGIFVGMPTQATSDPMFRRVRAWLTAVDADVPIALLHGRSRFNKEWSGLRRSARFQGIGHDLDGYGMSSEFGDPDSCCPDSTGQAAADWFLGRKRGLLAPVTVGTVDQLLHAATRTRHVMLRHAGLAGRVVILDEVHAYDVYMSQFLFEALRWLADARVPVVMLSATLPPEMRADLVRAYVQGATVTRDIEIDLPPDSGYPRTTVTHGGQVRALSSEPWRPSTPVRVELLAEPPDFNPAALVQVIVDEVRDGGCALMVCNTVDRAQAVYRDIRAVFGEDAVLLHARLTAAARAERTERLVDQLGIRSARPPRLVIVATQLAEQSFDVDVDLLVTDLAPIDLLLQRIGRLHRHRRPSADRPGRLRAPRVIVAGLDLSGDEPRFPGGSTAVYGDYLLLRAAALVEVASRESWSVPAQVPELVTAGYGDEPLGPAQWADRIVRAKVEHTKSEGERAANACRFLLAGADRLGLLTLDGLHDRYTSDLDDDDAVAAVVRDGDPSIEVVLVRQDARGYRTLAGRSIGPQGEGVSDDAVLEEVAGSTIRLPAHPGEITRAALELIPLSGWASDPWLSRTRALVLDAELSVPLGRHRLSYDDDFGLIVQRGG